MFEEPNSLNQVAEFHKSFSIPIEDRPTVPAKSRCDLRINLLQEELDELKHAVEIKDLKEILDALADLQYVLSGAVLEFGMAEIFNQANTEVHNSNMSKLCSDEEAKMTKTKHDQEHGEGSCLINKISNEKYIVLRQSDGKVIKNVNYKPAQLNKYI